MRIAISGLSGCGNTTATNSVGKNLNLTVFNFTFRDLAKLLNVEFDVLHTDSPNNLIYDYLTDLFLIRSSLKDNIIVGSRLAAWLIDADLRIWIHAPLSVRAERINKRESEKNSLYEAVLYKTLKRDEQNHQRYLRLYGIDTGDHNDFDITINTQLLTAEQVSSLITEAAKWAKQNHLERKNIHLTRIVGIISERLKISSEQILDIYSNLDIIEIYNKIKFIKIYV